MVALLVLVVGRGREGAGEGEGAERAAARHRRWRPEGTGATRPGAHPSLHHSTKIHSGAFSRHPLLPWPTCRAR